MTHSDKQNYTDAFLLYFDTNVRKKREAESSVYLAPPILLGLAWLGLDGLGLIWICSALLRYVHCRTIGAPNASREQRIVEPANRMQGGTLTSLFDLPGASRSSPAPRLGARARLRGAPGQGPRQRTRYEPLMTFSIAR